MSSPTVSRRSSSSSIAPKYGSLSIEGQLQAVNPRARRLAKLRELKCLDLQEVKTTAFNLPASTPFEVYSRLLKASSSSSSSSSSSTGGLDTKESHHASSIAQIGVPNEDNTRTVEMNTEVIEVRHQEMQFCYGDDTHFLNILQSIQEQKTRRKKGRGKEERSEGKQEEDVLELSLLAPILFSSSSLPPSTNVQESTSSDRLSSFLQRSSRVMEILIEEKTLREEALVESSSSLFSAAKNESFFFSPASKFESFGEDLTSGANELLRTRRARTLHFSKPQAHVLLATYPYSSHSDDLFPHKVNSRAVPTSPLFRPPSYLYTQ